MDMQHVLGRTWAAEGATALLPLYFLSEKDVILIDTGYAKLDRSGLTHLIDDNGLRLRGIITPTSTTPATSAISRSGTAAPPPSSSSRPASP